MLYRRPCTDKTNLTHFDITPSWDVFNVIFDQKMTELIHDECHWVKTKTRMKILQKMFRVQDPQTKFHGPVLFNDCYLKGVWIPETKFQVNEIEEKWFWVSKKKWALIS